MKNTVSLGVVTNNIRNDFQRMLNSVPSSIQSIVILDNTNDPDASAYWRKLSRLYELVVIKHAQPITDFAAARNTVLEKSESDWVLFLDSDEVFNSSQQELNLALERAISAQATGVSLLRSDIFYTKQLRYGEAGRQNIVRLIKTSACTFTGKTHEVAHCKGSLYHSSLAISHYAHQSVSDFISDVSFYARRVAIDEKRSFMQNLLELCLFPLGKLGYNLVFRAGVLDGWRGVVYASCMSLHSLLVRIYRYEYFYQKK